MRFQLYARNKVTKKDDKLFEFNEESMFDTYIDLVDKELYSDAMILENNRCRKYVEFKDYTPYFEKVKTLGRRLR